MWRVSSVSASTWCLFLLPLLVVAVATAITRSYRFVLRSRVHMGKHGSCVRRELLPDIRGAEHAPSAQFEIDLTVEAIVGTLGLLVVFGTLVCWGAPCILAARVPYSFRRMLGAAYTLVPAAADEVGWPMPVAPLLGLGIQLSDDLGTHGASQWSGTGDWVTCDAQPEPTSTVTPLASAEIQNLPGW